MREGMLATFMGRPFADQGGSGFHVHLSLAGEDGHNAFADEGGPDGLSPLAAQLHRRRDRARAGAAGAARADDQLVQADPPRQPRARRTRTGATTTAPPSAASRTSAARAPGSRCARPTAPPAPHLIIAALLLAGLDGIERELDATRSRRRRLLPAGRRPRRLDAARRPRRRARRARGRHGAHREARRDSSSPPSSR